MNENRTIKFVNDYPSKFFTGKTVLVRVDYNVPLEENDDGEVRVQDDSRIRFSMPTLHYLTTAQAKVILLSHLGRPGGKRVPELSLVPVAQKLNELAFGLIGYRQKVLFGGITNRATRTQAKKLKKGQIMVLENLRYKKGEKANEPVFAKRLAKLGEIYVNDAFSASHRRHASIVGLPQQLPQALGGLALKKEINNLDQIRYQPFRPAVLVLGGVKEDKLDFARRLSNWYDFLLVGGKLGKKARKVFVGEKGVHVAELREDGRDISPTAADEFSRIVSQAGTVVFAGPLGDTDNGHFAGTRQVVEAAIEAGVFSVAGGGDTESALTQLDLVDSISYIASGGGAMLAYLANGTLPGIEALEEDKK